MSATETDAIRAAADELIGQSAQPQPEPPKNKGGRPKGSRTRKRKSSGGASRAPRPETDAKAENEAAAAEQRVNLIAFALLATGRALTSRLELQTEWGQEQATGLAEVWEPVLALYDDADSPWFTAIAGTAVIVAPFAFELAARRAARGREIVVEADVVPDA